MKMEEAAFKKKHLFLLTTSKQKDINIKGKPGKVKQ